MKNFDLFEHHIWQPLAAWGFNHPFWSVHVDTLFYTWIAILVIVAGIILGRLSLRHPDSMGAYITQTYVRTALSLVNQTIPHCPYNYFAFIASLFTFILVCNCLIVLPFMEEPTKDLNTTVALALVSFLYVQWAGIAAHGIKGYIKEFFKPFAVMFPLELLSKLTTIISLSFRLFGNIFGGAIITSMWHHAIAGSIIGQLAGIFLGINILLTLFFGIFEGLVQAFVFSILTLTYLSMATSEEHE